MSGLCCCLIYLHLSIVCPSPSCSCHLCGRGCDRQGEHILDVGRRGEKEHQTQRNGVVLSIVAFGGQVTKSEIPEGSTGCRCEFVTGQGPEVWWVGGPAQLILLPWYLFAIMFLLEGEFEWQDQEKAAVSL